MLVLSSSKDDWTVNMEVSSSSVSIVDGVRLLSCDEKGDSVPSEIALRAFTTGISIESRHSFSDESELEGDEKLNRTQDDNDETTPSLWVW